MGVPVVMPDGESQQWMMSTACFDPATGHLHLRRLDTVYVEIDYEKQVSFAWVDDVLTLVSPAEGARSRSLVVADQVLVDGDGRWGIYPQNRRRR